MEKEIKNHSMTPITPAMISAGALPLYREESLNIDLAWAEALSRRVLEAALGKHDDENF